MATATTYGIWTEVQGDPPELSGINDKEIRWGVRPPEGQQSGYRFEGVSKISVPLDETEFTLGTFTHLNFPITVGSITAANLKLTIEIEGGLQKEFNFLFNHNETDNRGVNGTCPATPGYQPPCPDIVSIPSLKSQETIILEGKEYAVTITGFLQGNKLVNQFITIEGTENHAEVRGKLELRAKPTPPEQPKPTPPEQPKPTPPEQPKPPIHCLYECRWEWVCSPVLSPGSPPPYPPQPQPAQPPIIIYPPAPYPPYPPQPQPAQPPIIIYPPAPYPPYPPQPGQPPITINPPTPYPPYPPQPVQPPITINTPAPYPPYPPQPGQPPLLIDPYPPYPPQPGQPPLLIDPYPPYPPYPPQPGQPPIIINPPAPYPPYPPQPGEPPIIINPPAPYPPYPPQPGQPPIIINPPAPYPPYPPQPGQPPITINPPAPYPPYPPQPGQPPITINPPAPYPPYPPQPGQPPITINPPAPYPPYPPQPGQPPITINPPASYPPYPPQPGQPPITINPPIPYPQPRPPSSYYPSFNLSIGCFGIWLSVTEQFPGSSNLSGIGSSQINWGIPSGGRYQSGYRFDGVSTTATIGGSYFSVGTFTHFNFSIIDSITSASLNLLLNINGTQARFSFVLEHQETPNEGANGTPDIVTLTNAKSREVIVINQKQYVLQLAFYQNNQVVERIVTVENQINSVQVLAVFVEVQSSNQIEINPPQPQPPG